MVRNKGDAMGRFSVDLELANHEDVVRARAGDIAPDRVRRMTVRGVVDTGANRLVLSESVVSELGLPAHGEIGVRYADGRIAQRRQVGEVELSYIGRSSVFNAIVEPDRNSALIGAIVLEDLDLIVDCTHQTLGPRDPKQIISEIE